MSDESKKVEKKAEQTEQEVKPTELSGQDLDKVAGGVRVVSNSSGGSFDYQRLPPDENKLSHMSADDPALPIIKP
jgi:hypothetical protein